LSEGQHVSIIGTLRLCADIVRFRKGPEDLPVSRAMLAACVVAGVAAQTLVAGSMLPADVKGSVFAMMVIRAVVVLVAVAVVLFLVHRPERFLQTATSVFGCQLVLLPFSAVAGWLTLHGETHVEWKLPAMVVAFVFQVWGLAVLARILRSATSWPLVGCIAAALLMDLVTLAVIAGFFPAADLQSMPAQSG
jgi:hypothetical protein